ncbi:mini-ribonuclease 3 [Ligilactobacillus salitolerans]|uniref:Mini-ribonuclease 3 n=1 Tax=Ligilactobacillus salitolerans TaxID=1808352 RepID=A0A401IUS9_9LACO|nr:ribonuclease III domain-containing protein [Ligilactobacillus salitolerans]GBG95284.1 mini-ribonuclease 3 [Ligilactobacillus salitolerans]
MTRANYQLINGIALAYIGDAVWEVFVREHLLEVGLTKPNKLQKTATHYVSAKAQAFLIEQMEAQKKLSDAEWTYFKKGRNAKSRTSAKNTAVLTYRISTGFEALFGYLYTSEQDQRLKELAQWCIETVEAQAK